jgi:hypothetical protein
MVPARDAAKTMSDLVEKLCQKFDHSVSRMQIDSMDPLTITVETVGGLESHGMFRSHRHTVTDIIGHTISRLFPARAGRLNIWNSRSLMSQVTRSRSNSRLEGRNAPESHREIVPIEHNFLQYPLSSQ